MNANKYIQKKIYLKEFNKADKIIRYLLNPDDDSIELTKAEKEKYDILKKIHGYRSQYSRKNDLIAIIKSVHGVKDRQAYMLINECEYVFGKITGVDKDYERNFLLDVSLKNIEIAMASRNSLAITKALTFHYKAAGLAEFIPEMPDFSKLEQHKYIISLPPEQLQIMLAMVKRGSVSLEDFIPPPDINTSGIEAAKDLNEEDGK
jgi:hypothetical protein